MLLVSARNKLVSLLHPLSSLTPSLSALHPNFIRPLWFVLNVLSYAGSDYTTTIHMYMYWNSGGYIGNTRKNGGYNGCSWGPSWELGVNFACGMRVLLVRVGMIVLQYAERANAWYRWPCCRMDPQFEVSLFHSNVLMLLLALWVCVYVMPRIYDTLNSCRYVAIHHTNDSFHCIPLRSVATHHTDDANTVLHIFTYTQVFRFATLVWLAQMMAYFKKLFCCFSKTCAATRDNLPVSDVDFESKNM